MARKHPPDPVMPIAEAWEAEPWSDRYTLCIFNLWAVGFLTDAERTSAYEKLLTWQGENGGPDPLHIDTHR